jgi:23S rRNA (pseudouridine1915-N3)-methyltransferase
VHLTVLAVGTRSPGWVREAYDDYARRLKSRLPVRLQEIEPGKRGKGIPAQRAMDEEGRRILAAVRGDTHLVMLDEHGRQRTSVALSEWLGERLREGRELAFAIGGPDGFAPEVRARAQETWSLSTLTLPHALVRVVLIEQLYRAVTLLDGHPYHRE